MSAMEVEPTATPVMPLDPVSPTGISLPAATLGAYSTYGPTPARALPTQKSKRKTYDNTPAHRGETRRVKGNYRKKYSMPDGKAILQKLEAHSDANNHCFPYDPKDKGQLVALMRTLCKKSTNNPNGIPQSQGGKVPLTTMKRHWEKYAREKMNTKASEDQPTVEEWQPPVLGKISVFLQLSLHTVLAGFIGWRSSIKYPCTEEEAGEVAAILYTNSSAYSSSLDGETMVVKREGLPKSWEENGNAPPKWWWNWFYNLPDVRHIVKRKMNSLSEARAAASQPHVITKWFDDTEKEMEPTVFTAHVVRQYPVIAEALRTAVTVANVIATTTIAAIAMPSDVVQQLLAQANTATLIDTLLHDPARNAW